MWDVMDPGSWICASQRKGNTGLPQSRRQSRDRSTFMRQCHVAGCSPEEEKMETSEELFTGERPVPWLKQRHQISSELHYKDVVLVQTPAERGRNVLATLIMQTEKRRTEQKTWFMVVGLRIAADWQINFERTGCILRHRNRTSKGFGDFFKLAKESALSFSRIQWHAF